jgi:hypothetical protein
MLFAFTVEIFKFDKKNEGVSCKIVVFTPQRQGFYFTADGVW